LSLGGGRYYAPAVHVTPLGLGAWPSRVRFRSTSAPGRLSFSAHQHVGAPPPPAGPGRFRAGPSAECMLGQGGSRATPRHPPTGSGQAAAPADPGPARSTCHTASAERAGGQSLHGGRDPCWPGPSRPDTVRVRVKLAPVYVQPDVRCKNFCTEEGGAPRATTIRRGHYGASAVSASWVADMRPGALQITQA
jgi:hypothetical protein